MRATAALSIESLEAELKSAEKQLANATAERLRAIEVEGGWMTEVHSLRSLIDIRKKRLQGPADTGVNGKSPESENAPPLFSSSSAATARAPTSTLGPDSELSHVNWIVKRIQEAPNGLTPPELFAMAAKEGRIMHRNYPYTALRALLESKRIERRGMRYYGVTR